MTPSEATGDGRRVVGPRHQRVVELRRLIRRSNSRAAQIVLEGTRTVGDAIDAGLEPSTVVIAESGYDDSSAIDVCERLAADVEVIVVRDQVLVGLAPSVAPQPMLAVVDRPSAELPIGIGIGDLVLVLVDVADPGNVGTLVRVGDAVAATSVVVVGGADPWGPKAVRASAGSVLRIPVVTGMDIETVLTTLRGVGARIVGTDVREGRPHDSGVLSGGIAIVLGSETRGLDRSVESLIDDWVCIEMVGPTESLNVAMAGTLLAYEARRSASSG